VKPLHELLQTINEASSKQDLAKTMGKLARAGVIGPFATYISVDSKKSDQYTVYLSQSGLTLPDRDYYLEDTPEYTELRKQLVEYVGDMLAYVSSDSAKAVGDSILELETKIATHQWTNTANRDPNATYNRKSNEEIASMLGGFEWQAFVDECGLGKRESFVVNQPSYFEAMAGVWDSTSLETWKSYLTFKTIDTYASSLSEAIEQRAFQFHENAISGVDEQEPQWKRAVGITSSVLGEMVGQLFVEKHFTPQAKARMNELVENLKRAFEKRIETRDWMGDGTKKQALEKLSMFTTKIGYPDKWKDYTALNITPDSISANLVAASEFEYNRELNRVDDPVDRGEWHMTPQTINAYYNPTMNEIVFPAAILQPPFFNMAADDAVNYGAIGAVIGHELSHGFDDKGSEYDGKGNLRQWWTQEDRTEFERRAAGLVGQYNGFKPVEDMSVNGELTLGENIGDLGGLSVAYEAYRLSLGNDPAPVIDGLTGDQRFFLGWSQIWRRLYREPELRRRLIVDPHSPSEYRVNGIVRNMDAWYDAFDIQAESPLYLKPEDRVRIW
jgi:putative endopeptidase